MCVQWKEKKKEKKERNPNQDSKLRGFYTLFSSWKESKTPRRTRRMNKRANETKGQTSLTEENDDTTPVAVQGTLGI